MSQPVPIEVIRIPDVQELADALAAERRLLEVLPHAVERSRKTVQQVGEWERMALEMMGVAAIESGSEEIERVEPAALGRMLAEGFRRGMVAGLMVAKKRTAERS